MPTIIGFDWQPRTRVIFGPGSLDRLGELAREEGASKVLLVTDAGIVAAGHVEHARRALESAGVAVAVFDGVRENPTTRDVDDCLAVARSAGIDAFVGLGGGSSLDTAKGCNFLLTNGGRMQDYWGTGKATRPMLPLIAVPTTAGTGSECQSYALIADEETHQKMACGDPKAAARIALLDPTLTLSQPQRVTAGTGIDALAHALETAVTLRRNELSLVYAREAFRLIIDHLPRVLSEPDDLEARAATQLGAAYAGTAIELSMLGAAHAAANPLTAHYGIVHGQAVGMMLPHVIRFNAEVMPARRAYEDLVGKAVPSAQCPVPGGDGGRPRTEGPPGSPGSSASELGTGHWALGTASAASEALVARLKALLTSAGVPTTLREFGVDEAALPRLAVEAAAQWTAGFNPRPVAAADFEGLYRAAMES